jgi:diketogulonate reductase-like aldo/keto reductase
VTPLPRRPFRKLERLDENIGAAEVALTSDDLREIDSAASKITVQGVLYPEPGATDRSVNGHHGKQDSRL